MSSTIVRKSIKAAIVLAAVGTLIVTALPFIASTQIVRDRIAVEMSAWSGYRVKLGAVPEIEVWPLRAILNDVTLSGWNDPERKPVIIAEQVEIELSALAALRGDVVFSTTRLIRPTLRLASDGGQTLYPLSPGVGRIARAIAIAREALNDNADAPDLSAISSDRFGRLEFVDGRILIETANKEAEIISDIGGALNWTALDRSGSLAATGTWRGESVVLNLTMAKPLLLFAGGSAPLSLLLQSNPADLTFDGSASFSRQPYFSGTLSFSTPSLANLLEWTTHQQIPALAEGPIAISGAVAGDNQRIRFDNSRFTLDGKPGQGALDLALTGDVPMLSGTLAFDTLDIRSALTAFAPFAAGKDTQGTVFADYLNLDLRLSAARADVGPAMLSNVAATAQIKPGLTVFDISDASVFGGTVQAGVRFDLQPQTRQVELRLLASDIDGGLLAGLSDEKYFIPASRGTISATIKGEGKSLSELLQHGVGSLSASFGKGNFSEVDLNALLRRMKQGGFFPLADASNGTMPIDSAELRATVANGAAHIEKIEIKAPAHTIILSGIVSYVDGGLALSGLIYPLAASGAEPPAAEAIFFVGGSRHEPFFAPVNHELPNRDPPSQTTE